MDGVMKFLRKSHGDDMPTKKLHKLHTEYIYERTPRFTVSEINYIVKHARKMGYDIRTFRNIMQTIDNIDDKLPKRIATSLHRYKEYKDPDYTLHQINTLYKFVPPKQRSERRSKRRSKKKTVIKLDNMSLVNFLKYMQTSKKNQEQLRSFTQLQNKQREQLYKTNVTNCNVHTTPADCLKANCHWDHNKKNKCSKKTY
jgi:hypothetical protein